MLSKIKFGFYARVRVNKEIKDRLFKENLDLKTIFQKEYIPRSERLWEKVMNNRKRIVMCTWMILLLNQQRLYNFMLGGLYYRDLAFMRFKAYVLGPESTYSCGVIQHLKGTNLSEQLQKKFIDIDDQLPLGITRKFMIRILKECQIQVPKEERKIFYALSGFKGLNSKRSGVDIRSLEYLIIQYQLQEERVLQAMDSQIKQELQWQLRTKSEPLKKVDNEQISRRIAPVFDRV